MASIFHVVGQVDVPVRCDLAQAKSWIAQGLANLRTSDINPTRTGLHFRVVPTILRTQLDPLAYVDSGSVTIDETQHGYIVKYELDCTPSAVVLCILFLAMCLAFAVSLVFDRTIAPVGVGLLAFPLLGFWARDYVSRKFSAWLRILPSDHAR